MSPSTRKMAIAAVCVAVALAGFGFGASSFAHKQASERDLELSERAARVTNLVLQVRRLQQDALLDRVNRDSSASSSKQWDDSRALLSDAIARTYDLHLNDEDVQALRQIAADYRVYVDGYERVVALIRSGQVRTAQQAIERISIYQDRVQRMQANSAAINARALQRINKLS